MKDGKEKDEGKCNGKDKDEGKCDGKDKDEGKCTYILFPECITMTTMMMFGKGQT